MGLDVEEEEEEEGRGAGAEETAGGPGSRDGRVDKEAPLTGRGTTLDVADRVLRGGGSDVAMVILELDLHGGLSAPCSLEDEGEEDEGLSILGLRSSEGYSRHLFLLEVGTVPCCVSPSWPPEVRCVPPSWPP